MPGDLEVGDGVGLIKRALDMALISARGGKPIIRARRLYQVKLLVEESYQPGVEARNPDPKREYKDAKRIIVVIGDLRGPKSKAETDFDAVKKSSDLFKKGKALDVRSRTFMVARMESTADEKEK